MSITSPPITVSPTSEEPVLPHQQQVWTAYKSEKRASKRNTADGACCPLKQPALATTRAELPALLEDAINAKNNEFTLREALKGIVRLVGCEQGDKLRFLLSNGQALLTTLHDVYESRATVTMSRGQEKNSFVWEQDAEKEDHEGFGDAEFWLMVTLGARTDLAVQAMTLVPYSIVSAAWRRRNWLVRQPLLASRVTLLLLKGIPPLLSGKDSAIIWRMCACLTHVIANGAVSTSEALEEYAVAMTQCMSAFPVDQQVQYHSCMLVNAIVLRCPLSWGFARANGFSLLAKAITLLACTEVGKQATLALRAACSIRATDKVDLHCIEVLYDAILKGSSEVDLSARLPESALYDLLPCLWQFSKVNLSHLALQQLPQELGNLENIRFVMFYWVSV